MFDTSRFDGCGFKTEELIRNLTLRAMIIELCSDSGSSPTAPLIFTRGVKFMYVEIWRNFGL